MILDICNFEGAGFGFYYLAAIYSPFSSTLTSDVLQLEGISTVGLSVGTCLWPPVVERLILFFGWRGALLIHCAILMNGLVLGALMRPFPASDRQTAQQNSSKDFTVNSKDTKMKNDSGHCSDIDVICSQQSSSEREKRLSSHRE